MEVRRWVGWVSCRQSFTLLVRLDASIKVFQAPRHVKICWSLILHDDELENHSPIVDIRRDGFDVFELRSVNSPARTRSNLSKSLSMGSFSWES